MSSPAAPDADPQDRSAADSAASPPSDLPASKNRAPDGRTSAGRVTAFLRSPAGNAALLGTCGSVLMTFGSFGAGSVRRQDPLLEEMFLSWLRFGHGQLLSMIILWVGVLIMIGAWVRVGRATLAGTGTLDVPHRVVPCGFTALSAYNGAGQTVAIVGPTGAFDAVVAMYHDQGHIPVKVAAPRRSSSPRRCSVATHIRIWRRVRCCGPVSILTPTARWSTPAAAL